MPYIGVSTSKKLSDAQKDALKSALGEKISVIPGKTEKALMVDIADGHTMYFAGEKTRTCVFGCPLLWINGVCQSKSVYRSCLYTYIYYDRTCGR